VNSLNRYALETRLMLDLVSHELQRLRIPHATEIQVVTKFPGLFEDLADRLWGHYTLLSTPVPSNVVIYLLSLEEGIPRDGLHASSSFVAAFRNHLSHKSILYGDWHGLWYPGLEREMKKTHRLVSSWGIMKPTLLPQLALASSANRFGRFDLGFYLSDRALRVPLSTGLLRYLCPFGVISGRKL
jgi:hypothetical protein